MADEFNPGDSPGDPTPTDGGTPSRPESNPVGDELDPELVRMARPPFRRSPIVALGVIILGAVLLWHLRTDLVYALSSRTPIALGQAREFSARRQAPPADNRLVELRGLPDYRNALLFEPRGDSFRRAFFRLLGSDSHLLVGADQTSTRHEGLGERFVGRWRRFDEIPYAEQVRAYYATKIKATRLLDLEEVRRLLRQRPSLADNAPGGLIIRDGAGEPIRLAPTQPLTLVVDFPDHLALSLSRDHYAVAEDAQREIERLGAVLVGEVQVTKESFVVIARVAAENRRSFLAALEERDIPFAAHQERWPTTAESLRQAIGAPERLAIGERSLPWSQIASIQVSAPIEIPHDAWIVVENETPADFVWVPALAGVLILFLAFNLWLVLRTIRAGRAGRAQPETRQPQP